MEMICKGTSKYFNKVGKIKRLNDDEQKILLVQYGNGDESALYKLVECNLRLVVMVANKYRGMGVDFDDLINAGNLGLVKGIKKFDMRFNNKVSTYIITWIKQGVFSELASMSRTVRIPYNRFCDMGKLNKESEEKGEGEFEQKKRDKDIIELINGKDTSSLDDVIIKSFDNEEKEVENRMTVESIMNELTPEEKKVIELSFGLKQRAELSIEELARTLSKTKREVKRIRYKAMRKLKKAYSKLLLT